jgi:hypothetical protein
MKNLPDFFYVLFGKIDPCYSPKTDNAKHLIETFRTDAQRVVMQTDPDALGFQRRQTILVQSPGAIPSAVIYPKAKSIAKACVQGYLSGNAEGAQSNLCTLLDYLIQAPKQKGFAPTKPFLVPEEIQDLVLVGFCITPQTKAGDTAQIPLVVLYTSGVAPLWRE